MFREVPGARPGKQRLPDRFAHAQEVLRNQFGDLVVAADDGVPETFGERHKNLPAKIPSVNYTNPWLGGCWPLRQPVEYMITASRAYEANVTAMQTAKQMFTKTMELLR